MVRQTILGRRSLVRAQRLQPGSRLRDSVSFAMPILRPVKARRVRMDRPRLVDAVLVDAVDAELRVARQVPMAPTVETMQGGSGVADAPGRASRTVGR